MLCWTTGISDRYTFRLAWHLPPPRQIRFPSSRKATRGAGSPCQGSALRSDERLTPPPLTAARATRRELATKGICFFFQARTALEKRKKGENQMTEKHHATWGELLRDAVETPGRMLSAYTAFHNYSFGNALLALEQCLRRKLEPGPLNTYRGWLQRKRQVRRGERGITLCMPLPYKAKKNSDAAEEESVPSSRPTRRRRRSRIASTATTA